LALLLAALVTMVGATGAGAAEAPKLPSSPGLAKLTQYPLPPEDLFPYAIAAGPNAGPDQMWFTAGKGQPGRTAVEQKVEPVIGRISFGGEIREFSPSTVSLQSGPNAITAGNDGAMWFLGQGSVGRITQDGQVSSFPVNTGHDGAITSGSDGNLWLTKNDALGGAAIVRLTLSGQATEFPLEPGAGLGTIVPGPDGNLWFTEAGAERIGRITPAGALTEFKIGTRPADLSAGHDGNIWYSTDGGIGHISTSGKVFKPIAVEGGFGALAAGPDLRLWFGEAGGLALGRVTPDGRRSLLELPKPAVRVTDLATGTLGSLWYIASAEGSCMGGGGSCQILRPSQSGVIGKIQQSGPVVTIKRTGFSVSPRWARVRLGCLGGEALGLCRGELTLETRAGVLFGRKRFLVRTETTKVIPLRLLREGREAVLAGKRLRLVVNVEHPEGTPTSRTFVVPPKPRP
jgi:virginiamycin B lyase